MAIDKSGWVLGRLLAGQAARRGTQNMMEMKGGGAVTYAQADTAANRIANGLASLGVGQGDRVAVMLPNGLELLHSWFGIARSGGVFVAVNTAYRGMFLEHVLANAAAEVMVIDRAYLPWLQEIEAQTPALRLAIVPGLRPGLTPGEAGLPSFQRIRLLPFEDLWQAPADPPTVEVRYSDIACILYTSGTTGPSKGVLMPHAHCYLLGLGTVESLRLTERDVYYICMPLFHTNALLMQFYGTLIAGGRAWIAPVFTASGWTDDLRASGATVTNTLGVMTDFIYRQPPRPDDDANSLRVLLAIPAPKELRVPFQQRFQVQMVEAYGMTEINIPLYHPLEGDYRPGSAGKVLEKYFEMRIVDPETDEPLGPGEVGEIVARSKEPFGFMAGYNAMDDKTVEAWRNFWFHTGDAGYRDADGYYYFADRIKDRIRRRGENIAPYEIEQVLAQHPAVAEVAAIAVKGEFAGGEDEIKACLVLKPGQPQPRPEEVLDFCQGKMPHFAVPRYLEFLPTLPKTPTEKVQKAKLREAGLTPTTWDREQVGYQLKR